MNFGTSEEQGRIPSCAVQQPLISIERILLLLLLYKNRISCVISKVSHQKLILSYSMYLLECVPDLMTENKRLIGENTYS